jgi:hypothetical protein
MIEFNPLSFAEELEKLAYAAERKGILTSWFDNSQRKGIDRRGERQYSKEVTEGYRRAKASGYRYDIHSWVNDVGEDFFESARDAKSKRAVIREQQRLYDKANPSLLRQHGGKILAGAALAGAAMYVANKNKQPNLVVNMPDPPQPAPIVKEVPVFIDQQPEKPKPKPKVKKSNKK